MMDNLLPSFKEVYISKPHGFWTEITVNTEGIPSTLQDIKAQQRSSGYAYKNYSNRFIYWRTTHDVLELIEESLDVNLFNNQLKYTFTDSPILDGVTVVEVSSSSVVILVPTLCSVHRIVFPHPDLISKKFGRSGVTFSIFHGTFDSKAISSHHVIQSISSNVVAGSACLNANGDAVFGLALRTGHILLVNMLANGITREATLSAPNVVSRLMHGLSGFLGKDSNKHACTSMVFHVQRGQMYLFCLEHDGNLRAWNCENLISTCLQVFTPVDNSNQNCKLCKGYNKKGELLLGAFIRGEIAIIKPFYNDMLKLMLYSSPTGTHKTLSLVDMVLGQEGEVWCSWTTSHDSPLVTRVKVSVADEISHWDEVVLAKPTIFEYPSEITLDPAQLFLDKIMNSGFCITPDLKRTLSVLKSDHKLVCKGNLREQIRSIVDSEIYEETVDTDLDDNDIITVSERLWSSLYLICIQYLSTGLSVSGLVWLPNSSSIIMIKQHGYSLVRKLSNLELAFLSKEITPTVASIPYIELVQLLKKCDISAALDKLELGLHLGDKLHSYIAEAANILPDNVIALIHKLSNEESSGLSSSLRSLVEDLLIMESVSKPDGEGFMSEAGISAVVTTFREICSLRLKVCELACILLHLYLGTDIDPKLDSVLKELCQLYKGLVWLGVTPLPSPQNSTAGTNNPMIASSVGGCNNPASNHTPSIVESFYSSHPEIGQSSLTDTLQLLLQTIWPMYNCEVIANHLFAMKRYDLLQTYASQVNYTSWILLLVQSYLATGEPHKAFNLVFFYNYDIQFYMKAISQFEKFCYPDYVIYIVDSLNLSTNLKISQADRETLYSLKFMHSLSLGEYNSAYSCILSLPDPVKKTDFLHKLVIDLIANGRYDLLTSFSFHGLHDQLEKLLTVRSRSLDLSKAERFYTLLYCLHIKNKNFKKAASVMYEQSLRVENSESQWKYLSISYNALMCLDRKDAFIVKPSEENTIDIVDAKAMKKELVLAKYRFYLECSPEEKDVTLVSRCISDKLFTKAMELTTLCGLDRTLVMEAFTAEVAALAGPGPDFKWLCSNDDDHIEHTISRKNCGKIGWRLLRYTMEKYEKDCETSLHKAIANQLLRMKCFLPVWLINSYKKRNAAELLRVYMKFGDFSSASNLAIDYINAGLGVGHEEFSLSAGMSTSSPPVYIPLFTIDLLLRELNANNDGEELKAALDKYVESAKRITEDKIVISRSI